MLIPLAQETIIELRGIGMNIFSVLNLIGGLCLFLFGMNLMGQALERRAGSGLRTLLGRLTSNKWAGLLTGLGITAIIQSSSATTVMAVGFVNSGLMSLSQSIHVIMGANIGTTVTAWILSLAGIDSHNVFIQLLKPSSFTPILALIGIILHMFSKDDRKKDSGTILLGFATLMYGMDAMSGSVAGLRDVPEFRQLFVMFTNPILGVAAGALLTGIIQSSSASVGILQALAATGQVSYGAAIPIIMGQNIGTCVTALISSVGANKNAKRTAMVHLSFNVIGTIVWLTVFCIVKTVFAPALFGESATMIGIAIAHSLFNIACTIIMLPLGGVLEKLVCFLIPDGKQPTTEETLDERLLATPTLALERCRLLMDEMSASTKTALLLSLDSLTDLTPELANEIRRLEDKTDHYEDIIGTYLVKLSAHHISEADSLTAAEYLKLIGDLERIADHSVNILESAEEMQQKGIVFSDTAKAELKQMLDAVREIAGLADTAFTQHDLKAASMVEPLEQVVDELKDALRTRHIQRLQSGVCSIDAGFVLSDLLTNLERVSDHCSNIAGCVLDAKDRNLNLHESLSVYRKNSEDFKQAFASYRNKYALQA